MELAGNFTTITAAKARAALGVPDFNVAVFGSDKNKFVVGHNPSNQLGWQDAKVNNPIGLYVDVGNYGNPTFSGFSIPEAITGGISIPVNSDLWGHASGIAGYSRTYSLTGPRGGNNGAVGVYGQGDSFIADGHAWGLNTRTQDNGFKTNALWGAEFDVNVTAAGTLARGVDIVGGSSQAPDDASPAIIVQAIGVFATPKIPWGRGLLLNDACAKVGVEIGTANEAASSMSMPLFTFYRDGSNVRRRGFSLQTTGGGGTKLKTEATNGLLQLSGNNGGAETSNVRIYGGNTGIGDGGALPTYPLDVFGASRFTGNIGFGGNAPVSRPTLPAAATDLASSITLLNAIRTALINNGLAQ